MQDWKNLSEYEVSSISEDDQGVFEEEFNYDFNVYKKYVYKQNETKEEEFLNRINNNNYSEQRSISSYTINELFYELINMINGRKIESNIKILLFGIIILILGLIILSVSSLFISTI